jgi:hypothetical protein
VLSTPLTVDEIIYGHWLAMQRFFLWPVVVASILMLLPAVSAIWREQAASNEWDLLNPMAGVAVFQAGTFILDLIALAWVGMWFGLTHTKAIQAFAKTVLFVIIGPAVVFCFPNVLFDVFYISWARSKLQHDFRSAALEPFARSPGGPWAMVAPKSGASPPVIAASPM